MKLSFGDALQVLSRWDFLAINSGLMKLSCSTGGSLRHQYGIGMKDMVIFVIPSI